MKYCISFLAILLLLSCGRKEKADLLIYNARINTVDPTFSKAEAFAVKDGKFISVGSSEDILKRFESPKKIDAKGAFIYPGLFDAHCHFYSYGKGLSEVDLVGTKSFQEVLERVKAFANRNPKGWIIGRGWNQMDWPVKEFPDRAKLDSLFPDRPVFLKRVDGHAALANGEALKRAGIKGYLEIEGGRTETRHSNQPVYDISHCSQCLSGVLIDNAIDLVAKVIPQPSKEQQIKYLLDAQKNCFAVGLTTIDEAGLDKEIVELIDSLQKIGSLKMRIYAMLLATDENFKSYFDKGIYKTDWLDVRSFKFFADGALGSRGACLLQPYTDRPEERGFLLHPPAYYKEMAAKLINSPFQMNTHCIGDSANRLMLKTYGEVLKGKNDRRWRIEHAQVVEPEEMPLFGKYSIIPSIQPTHATSDKEMAVDRLGPVRVKYGYAYKELLKKNGLVADGSDFPVESINPLLGFYAGVWRIDKNGNPPGGFQPENALSREEALKAMTIWAAYSNFEEKEKGSIELEKLADFAILNGDLMTASPNEVLKMKVLETWIGGERVY